jgi:hypothetical protein
MLVGRKAALHALRAERADHGVPEQVAGEAARGTEVLLEGLVAAKVMVEMDGHYLSLAVVRNRAGRKAAVHTAVEHVREAEAFVQLV